jgi:UDP-2,3-diacylglucosamine pyrophosphatase LpxH
MSDISTRKHLRTIIISDIHLGTAGAKAREVVHFLLQHTCDTLVLNGDVIDAWELKKYGKWKVKHTRFFKVVLKMMEENDTKVIYLHGNHDDFIDTFIPLQIGNLSMQMDYHLQSANGKNYHIVHGDIFDNVTTNFRWLAQIGSLAYTFSLWLNKCFNFLVSWFGIKPLSISKYLKGKVKSFFSPNKSYENKLVKLAKEKNCEGIICGHTHKPAFRMLEDNIFYMNSGDWVESLTALTEDFEGNWELIYYNEQFGKFPDNNEQMVHLDNVMDKLDTFSFIKKFGFS